MPKNLRVSPIPGDGPFKLPNKKKELSLALAISWLSLNNTLLVNQYKRRIVGDIYYLVTVINQNITRHKLHLIDST